jgi:hypothetical protein
MGGPAKTDSLLDKVNTGGLPAQTAPAPAPAPAPAATAPAIDTIK